jgi:hypothetical protein
MSAPVGHTGEVRTIGFLHTSPVHVTTFERLVDEAAPGTAVISAVDASLLERARRDGIGHAEVVPGAERAIVDLIARGADVIVCTCSTIGGVAESVGRRRRVEVVRVDRPMVELAVAVGRRIGVVAAVESTVEPTIGLIDEVAAATGSDVDSVVHVVEGAWAAFEAGDQERYIGLIADVVRRIAPSVDVVILAQASMAPAAEAIAVDVPVLASPRTAVDWLTTH